MHRIRRILPLALIGLLNAQTRPDSITLEPVADTTLFETNPDNNLGAEATLAAGTTARGQRSRALLRFDLAGRIPAGARIEAASLRIAVTKVPSGGGNDSTFGLRRVLVSWGEGDKKGKTGMGAGAGEATWNARLFPDTPWSAPGGAEGVDFSDAISASLPIQGVGSYTFASNPALIEDVRFWLESPDSNFGWVLRTQSEEMEGTARRFASRENTAQSPALLLEYSAPAEPLRIETFVIEAGEGTITWSGGEPPYQLQQKLSLTETNWSNLGETVQTNTVQFPVEGAAAFYRVMLPEAAAAPGLVP